MKRKVRIGTGVILGICIILLGICYWGKRTIVSEQVNFADNELNVERQEEDVSKNNLEKAVQGRGVEYVYDKLNRLEKVIYTDGSYITYSYDKNGNMRTSKVTTVVTPTPVRTETPHQNIAVVYYQNSNWENAYIHYRIGNGEWTKVPGVEMTSSTEQKGYKWKYSIDLGSATEATVCFNNGNESWDSRNLKNYKVYAGIYGIRDESVNKLQNIVATATPGKNSVEVYYNNTSWSEAYIHYKVGDGKWTKSPGIKMDRTNKQAGYRWKYTIDLGSATEATVCFNNGNESWDSRNRENYKVYVGDYGVKNETVYKLQTVEETSSPSKNVAEVYYDNSKWTKAYIHYRIGNGEWTDAPGEKMTSTDEQSGYRWKYVIDLGIANELTVCFNNGEEDWDSRNRKNYLLSGSKRYGVKNETIYKLK